MKAGIAKILISLSLLTACGPSDSSSTNNDKASDPKTWRYFDRELFFPTGVSVSPEMAAAQDVIQFALDELQNSTDLGADYFIFGYDEDSLLQPLVTETSYQGRNWRSFFQIWDDEEFNAFAAEGVGVSLDEDVIAARNEKNLQEYFIIARLSCFTSQESCGFPSQRQSIALVWRAFGYLIDLRFGENAASAIMQAGAHDEQEDESEKKAFFAEFDNMLERVRNDLPPPEIGTEE